MSASPPPHCSTIALQGRTWLCGNKQYCTDITCGTLNSCMMPAQGKARTVQVDPVQFCERVTSMCHADWQLACDILHFCMMPAGAGLSDVGQDAPCLVHHLCILQQSTWWGSRG